MGNSVYHARRVDVRRDCAQSGSRHSSACMTLEDESLHTARRQGAKKLPLLAELWTSFPLAAAGECGFGESVNHPEGIAIGPCTDDWDDISWQSAGTFPRAFPTRLRDLESAGLASIVHDHSRPLFRKSGVFTVIRLPARMISSGVSLRSGVIGSSVRKVFRGEDVIEERKLASQLTCLCSSEIWRTSFHSIGH